MTEQRLPDIQLSNSGSCSQVCEHAQRWALEYCRMFLAGGVASWQDAVEREIVDQKALTHLSIAGLSQDWRCAELLALVHSSGYMSRQTFANRYHDLFSRIGVT